MKICKIRNAIPKALGLAMLLAVPAFGDTVLLNDPFTDGNRSNATGGDTTGGVWYQSSTTAGVVTIVDDSAGIGTGNALQAATPSDFYRLLTFFPVATLANPGDSLRATFDYRFPSGAGNSGGAFRIGLGYSAGTRQTGDGGSRTDDKNYGFDTNAGLASSTGTGVRYEDAGDDILGGSGAGTRFPLGTVGASVNSSTTKHSALLQITRGLNGDLIVQGQIDGLTQARGTHAGTAPVLTYAFDELALGFGGTGYRPTIILDNAAVSATTVSVLNISATDAAASRVGLDPATFTVTRTSTVGALSVPYTIAGTAVNGVDYQAISGTVSFTAGQGSATITITPIAAPFSEVAETAILTLGEPAGTLVQNGTATATLVDALTTASGQLEPEFSELYTFYVPGNSGARLWIDDRLIVARTFAQTGEIRGQIRLTSGQRVNYRLESFAGTGSLEWSSASRARQVIPGARILPSRADRAGGSILAEYWTNLPGATIATLTSAANYPAKPGGRELLTSFECLAQNWADNYGTRVTGYVVPPVSGSYSFAVSGDEVAELYLSPDANPLNKTLIASVSSATGFRQWTAQAGQQSSAVMLTQGQRYYVELLHKENTGTDHWSVGWKKPGDSAFSVIPGSALIQAGLGRTQPAQAAFLDTLAQDHPRLLATPQRFAWLRAMWQASAASPPKTWAQSAITSANTVLGQAPVAYTADVRGTILDQARLAKERMYYLGLAWWLTGDNQYAERAWTELNTLADDTAFPSWDPAHFLDVAEITHACAIGYDWFYNYWTPARRDTIRTALINKGLNQGLLQYTTNVGWQKTTGNNWNQVCNGGLILGALAVGTESETLTEDILTRALNSLRPVMEHYTTDNGAWYEGPGYWNYSTEYLVRGLAGLESALGSDFGISAQRLYSESGFYPLMMSSPAGFSFNHSDSGSGRITDDSLQWYARRFTQPLYAWYENTYGNGVVDALWWNDQTTSAAAAGLSPDYVFHGEAGTAFKPLEAVTLRGNWTDSRATYVGCKGGWVGADHGNLDGGDFVLDALGKRWFQELSSDDYALSGYFTNTPNLSGDDRWDYYRTRGEGQNTIIVDPGAGPDMTYNTVSPLLAYESEPGGQRSLSIFDLTPSTGGVSRLWRGFQLLGNRREVLIQDEIIAPAGRTVWWFAHYTSPATTVAIDPDGTAATLTQGAERLWVKVVSGGGAFQIMDATPLPTSPNPAGQNANTGFKKLAINLTNVTNTTLAVWMVPLSPGENPPTTLPAITPLNTWNLAAINDPPVTPNATVTTISDQPIDLDLRNYATDDETDASALSFSVSGAVKGSAVLLGDGHTARFTPVAGYTGVPTFDYMATDAGGLSSTGTFTITAAASSQIWTATSSGVWSSGANWSTALAPVSSRGATLEFFTGQTLGASTITASNDSGPFALNILTLSGSANAAASVIVSGGALTLTNNGTTNPVVNLSGTNGTGSLSYDINPPLTLAVPTTVQGNGTGTFRFGGDIGGAGSLTKTGSSTLIVTGTNSYSGGTTLSNGTLQMGNNTTTGTLPAGAVVNNGTLRFYRSDSALVVANNITGTGSLVFGASTGGTIGAITTLSGNNSFAGNVTVNSGAVRITNSNALGTATKTVVLTNGTNGQPGLRLDGSSGSIVLPASIGFTTSSGTTTNPAIVNEAGQNTIAGNFNISSGGGDTRLRVDAGRLTLTGDLNLTATSRSVYLAGVGEGVITGTISETAPNSLAVRKEDAGTWTLSGPLTSTGVVAVTAGTLVANGNITAASSVTVAASAILAGNGSIVVGTTISGTHRPGDGLGTQTFIGSLAYGSASHLVWELTANIDTGAGTNFDRVTAAGVTVTTNAAVDVTLNRPGSTVNFTDAFWSATHSWTVLTASSLTGTFKLGAVSADAQNRSVTGFGAFTLQHTASAVNLVWTPASPFQQWQAASFGANWNNAAVSGNLMDPNQNGIANLIECALSGDPMGNTTGLSVLPVLGRNASNHLTLTFTRVPSRTDLTLIVQGADTLGGPWTDLAQSVSGGAFTVLASGATVGETGSGDLRSVVVGDVFALTDPLHPRRFLRLAVKR